MPWWGWLLISVFGLGTIFGILVACMAAHLLSHMFDGFG